MDPTSIDAIADALGDSSFPVGGMSSPDGAVTLLLVALDDCPAILAALGDGPAAAEFLCDHRAVVDAAAARHDGQTVKAEQDAVMLSFPSAHAAVRCAIDLQRTISSLELPAVGRLRARAGLHTGFVIVTGDEVFGRNVVIAARIADQAAAGEILASAAVRDYTHTDPSLRFDFRGAVHLRGVHGEHEVYGIDWTG